ncbi:MULTISPECIES: potassium channel family protein [Streptomyces]|uniref:potassium channel family protein n=1 Tax=Streptomyces TaxID=1883 RepID=UPI002249210F|nr:potassium channel family protein [Streptomyces sp. JHD 1]MCX2970137.1 potassium channel family protein [Streptomyces sp. JHD 1]
MRAQTQQPADGWARVYFTGYTLFTLGTGDYVPGTAWTQVATTLAALTGLFVVTLSITYFVQVVQAVVHKREVAQHIHTLGRDGADIVVGGWTGERFSPMFDQHLVSLTAPLLRLAEQHVAYPIVQYFHAPSPRKAPACAVAALDDALLPLRYALPADARPDPSATGPLWLAVGQVLRTLRPFFPAAVREKPEVPLSALRRAGLPTVDEAEYRGAVRDHAERRRLLRGFLSSDGWDSRHGA